MIQKCCNFGLCGVRSEVFDPFVALLIAVEKLSADARVLAKVQVDFFRSATRR